MDTPKKHLTNLACLFAFASVACDARPSPCTNFDVHLEGPMRDVLSLLVVVDPHIAVERRAHLADALVSSVQILITGDRDADGMQEFPPPSVFQVAVITSHGELAQALPTPPPPTPSWFAAAEGGVISVWPRGSVAWDAWFVATTSQRMRDAFEMRADANTPTAAAFAFLHAHPRFAPGSNMLVLFVTDRDEEGDADLLARVQAMRALPIRTSFALFMAAPDGTNADNGDFAPLLAPQAFDEANVSCSDGSPVGQYPRRLLASFASLTTNGYLSRVRSLCSVSAEDAAAAFSWWPNQFAGVCLPTPLPSTDDGLVDCTATLLMPEYGEHRCTDLGLTAASVERTEAGSRERCVLPQVPHPPGAFPEGPPGFFYDEDSTSVAYACPGHPQRLDVTMQVALTGGTLDAQCHWPTSICLERVFKPAHPLSLRIDTNSRT
jgi:hypothetical protein